MISGIGSSASYLSSLFAMNGTNGSSGSSGTGSSSSLSQTEEKLFSSIDSNGDGSISQSEFSSFFSRRPARPAAARRQPPTPCSRSCPTAAVPSVCNSLSRTPATSSARCKAGRVAAVPRAPPRSSASSRRAPRRWRPEVRRGSPARRVAAPPTPATRAAQVTTTTGMVAGAARSSRSSCSNTRLRVRPRRRRFRQLARQPDRKTWVASVGFGRLSTVCYNRVRDLWRRGPLFWCGAVNAGRRVDVFRGGEPSSILGIVAGRPQQMNRVEVGS